VTDPTKRQAYLISTWAAAAADDLARALDVAQHTEDARLIARVRDVRDRAMSLYNDFRQEEL
jgi:hypothetical protein